jgi:hypothetical protein
LIDEEQHVGSHRFDIPDMGCRSNRWHGLLLSDERQSAENNKLSHLCASDNHIQVQPGNQL